MRRANALVVLIGLMLLAANTVPAEEIVKFPDGRFLKILGHVGLDRAVRLELPGGAFVVFPASRVEFIDRDGRIVYMGPDFTSAEAIAQTPSLPNQDLVALNRPPQM